MTDPRPDGSGVSNCIKYSIADACIEPDQINYINGHATSTPVGDLAEVNAIKKVFGESQWPGMRMNATKSMIGHCLGAAGGLEAIACIKAITSGYLHPTLNQDDLEDVSINTVPHEKQKFEVTAAISNSFGFGGHNSCVIFGPFKH